MALVQIKPGPVQVIVEARAKAYSLPRALAQVPGGLFPMKSAAFEMDEYRLLAGWPVPVPICDIRSETLVSGDGTMLADRETPTSVLTGANYRWLADPNFFNPTAVQWVPIQGGEPIWGGDPTKLPTLVSDYEYTIDDERFAAMTALNFDSDTSDYLQTDLGRVMSTVNGYTVIMVMSPNSIFGNDVELDFNALWCNPPDPDLTSVSLTIATQPGQDSYLWVELSDKPKQRGIAMAKASRISAPSYLAVVFNRPMISMYLGQGPANIASLSLDIGLQGKPFSTNVLLGKHPADETHNADLALFDLGLYGNALSPEDVQHEFKLLSKIYGGN